MPVATNARLNQNWARAAQAAQTCRYSDQTGHGEERAASHNHHSAALVQHQHRAVPTRHLGDDEETDHLARPEDCKPQSCPRARLPRPLQAMSATHGISREGVLSTSSKTEPSPNPQFIRLHMSKPWGIIQSPQPKSFACSIRGLPSLCEERA